MISSGEFIRGYTEMIILAILLNGDDYSYNISNKISTYTNGMVTISNPSLVIALKKMCDDGKVSSYNQLNEKNVNRKFYKITEDGKKFYFNYVEQYVESLDKIKGLIKGGDLDD